METVVVLFHKPFGVVSKFTREGRWESLADYGPFASSVYPVGRLDAESEGLLVLTNDSRIKQRLTEPRFRHPRTYLAQVERVPTPQALQRLRSGVFIEGYQTRSALVRLLKNDPVLAERRVPIRFRKNVPTAWLEITLTEGRNRQVRRMTAAVGYPTLRLVRIRVGILTLDSLPPGSARTLSPPEVRTLSRDLRLMA